MLETAFSKNHFAHLAFGGEEDCIGSAEGGQSLLGPAGGDLLCTSLLCLFCQAVRPLQPDGPPHSGDGVDQEPDPLQAVISQISQKKEF